MDTYEKLLTHPLVECVHPKFIAVVDGKKEFVAESVDGTVYLTEFGKKLLADAAGQDTEKPAKKGKKPAPVVESANTLVDSLDELDLGE